MSNAYASFKTRERHEPDQKGEEHRKSTVSRSCINKAQYETEADAQRVARFVSLQSHEKIRAYPCPFCHKWHIGHKNRRRVK